MERAADVTLDQMPHRPPPPPASGWGAGAGSRAGRRKRETSQSTTLGSGSSRRRSKQEHGERQSMYTFLAGHGSSCRAPPSPTWRRGRHRRRVAGRRRLRARRLGHGRAGAGDLHQLQVVALGPVLLHHGPTTRGPGRSSLLLWPPGFFFFFFFFAAASLHFSLRCSACVVSGCGVRGACALARSHLFLLF